MVEHNDLGLDDFLGHSEYDDEGAFLSNWRKEGSVVVWLHPRAQVRPLWSHTWWRVVEVKDKATKKETTKIRSWRWVSMEREFVNKKRTRRGKKTQKLDHPPQTDPIALLVEWVYQSIVGGRLNWTDEILFFESEDEDISIKAGGLCGLFQKRDITEDEKEQINSAGVYLTDAYKQSCQVKLQYVFRVIQDSRAKDGCRIAVESKTVGKKLQAQIRKVKDDRGDEGGSPQKNPYPFRWSYDEDKSFDDKYDITALPSREMSDEVRTVIGEDPPDIDEYTCQGNVAELRESMEQHWTHKDITPPWDELFAAAIKEVKGTTNAELPGDFDPDNYEDDDTAEEGKLDTEVGDEVYECDACGKDMQLSDFAGEGCPHCKTKYKVVDDEYVVIPKEEPKPPAKPKARAPKRATARAKNQPKEED